MAYSPLESIQCLPKFVASVYNEYKANHCNDFDFFFGARIEQVEDGIINEQQYIQRWLGADNDETTDPGHPD